MHRTLTAIALLLVLAFGGLTASLAAAQDATPAAGADRLFAETMGLPELAITATADAFEGVPAETPAGRYVVTLAAAPDVEFGAAVEFLLLPEGVTFADFTAAVAALAAGPLAAGGATPAAEPAASPAVAVNPAGIPAWYYQTHQAGGAAADAGFASQVVLDLQPGTYAVWGGEPSAPQAPVELAVTGEAATPAAGAEPSAGATITMFEYGFTIDGQLVPGPQTLEVANVGAQPHFTMLLRPSGPVTREQVGTLLGAEMAGTPTAGAAAAAGVSNPDEWAFVAYAGTLSMGAAEWIPVDLEPGTYVVVCFVPDLRDGVPHAYLGMFDVVTVGDAGTPAA